MEGECGRGKEFTGTETSPVSCMVVNSVLFMDSEYSESQTIDLVHKSQVIHQNQCC